MGTALPGILFAVSPRAESKLSQENHTRAPQTEGMGSQSGVEAVRSRGQVGCHSERKSIVVADDNVRFREDLIAMLSKEYEVVGAASDGSQLVELALSLRPDFLVVDVSMPVVSGLEAVDRLLLIGLHSKVVMLSSRSDPAYVQRAFRVGASAYVLKGTSFEDLPRALVAVGKGERFVSEGIRLDRP